MRPRHVAIALISFALLSGFEAKGDTTEENKLRRLERAMDHSRALKQRSARDAKDVAAEIKRLRRVSVEKARLERRVEANVAALERQLQAYRREATAREKQLAARRDEHAASLAALYRLARKPPVALLASPASATDAVRSSILIGNLSRRLRADAHRLGAQLDALQKLRREIAAKKDDLASNSAELEQERRELDQLTRRKAKMQARLNASAQRETSRQAQLAKEVKSLRSLINKVAERQRQQRTADLTSPTSAALSRAPPKLERTLHPFRSSRGRMPFPVHGSVISEFGAPDIGRSRTQGIKIATLSGAQVLAPHHGEIVFAGPFRSYGRLLIIAHGEGYHTLVAGLSRIDVTVGQLLLAGEPLGRMAEQSITNPVLYVEMRRKGAPFDPLPWLAALEREVSG